MAGSYPPPGPGLSCAPLVPSHSGPDKPHIGSPIFLWGELTSCQKEGGRESMR